MIDTTIAVDEFIKSERIAEVGRFAVIPERRNGVGVVLSLMRAATREIVHRGYTQLVTDVFENDPLRSTHPTSPGLPHGPHKNASGCSIKGSY